jgi:hypothetical protein
MDGEDFERSKIQGLEEIPGKKLEWHKSKKYGHVTPAF